MHSARKRQNLTLQRLAECAGISVSFLSQIENRRYVSKHGQTSRPNRDTVILLAHCLDGDVNEALELAGYAPEKPRTKEELFRALARLGVFEATFDGNLDDLTERDFEDLYDVLETHLKLELRRIARRRTPPRQK